MSKYTLTIEGDFEKGDCENCPLSYNVIAEHNLEKSPLFGVECITIVGCPLEEATVAKNATVEGEWINIGHNGTFKCSVCGKHPSRANFCPECGADMKGGN